VVDPDTDEGEPESTGGLITPREFCLELVDREVPGRTPMSVRRAAMTTWQTGTADAGDDSRRGGRATAALEEAALDEVCRPEGTVARIGPVFRAAGAALVSDVAGQCRNGKGTTPADTGPSSTGPRWGRPPSCCTPARSATCTPGRTDWMLLVAWTEVSAYDRSDAHPIPDKGSSDPNCPWWSGNSPTWSETICRREIRRFAGRPWPGRVVDWCRWSARPAGTWLGRDARVREYGRWGGPAPGSAGITAAEPFSPGAKETRGQHDENIPCPR